MLEKTTRSAPVLWLALVVVATVVAAAVPATAGRAARGVPPEVADHVDDWPVPGQDYGNSRAAVTPIDASNVTGLEEAWTVELDGGASTAPLIVGDTVYVQDTSSAVRAVDRETGAVRWTRQLDEFTIGPHGVAVGWGSVFATTGKSVAALDAETGELRWKVRLTQTDTEGVDIQPVAYARRVLASTVPVSVQGQFVGGDRGVISALDVETGDTVWSFDTVKSDDLWGNPEINSGGGAWYTPSIDVATGMTYWGTGNPSPFPGTKEFPNGTSRPGPNLYTESTVALPIRTGKLRWYYQAHPHDLFDRDFVHTMVIDVADGDEARTIVVGAGKGGVVVGLDPRTGKRLWKASVGEHRHDQLRELAGPVDMLPGTYGGIITPPAAADGIVYVATVNAPTELVPDEPRYIGSDVGTMDGEIAAIDAQDGSEVWATRVPGDPMGGITVVNDLLLTNLLNGDLLALDRATGEIVWTRSMGGTVNGWTSVAGDLVLVPVGGGDPSQLVALRLPG